MAATTDSLPKRAAAERARIDGPHSANTSEANRAASGQQYAGVLTPDAQCVREAAAVDPAANQQQFEKQAGELAEYLRDRRRELDRREAQLNARIAKLENELRLARLQLSERENASQEAKAELNSQVLELEARLQAVAACEVSTEQEVSKREAELQLREEALNNREEQVVQREKEITERQQALREQLVAVEVAEAPFSAESKWRERLGELSTLEQWKPEQWLSVLENWECRLQEAAGLLERERQHGETTRLQLQQERQSFESERQRQQETIRFDRQQWEEKVRKTERSLEAQRQRLAEREASVQQLYEETVGVHRQTLELQLIVQQMWAEITKSIPPSQATQKLTSARHELAALRRLEQDELQRLRNEIQQMGQQLENRMLELQQRREAFDQWARRQQGEIEAQAARLVAREAELMRQEQQQRAAAEQWEAEKNRLLSRWRSLLSETPKQP